MDVDAIHPDGAALLISEIVISAARDLCSKAPIDAQETARAFLGAAGLEDRADVIYRHSLRPTSRRQILGLYSTPRQPPAKRQRGN